MVIDLAGLASHARQLPARAGRAVRRATPPAARAATRPAGQEVAGAALVCLALACWQPVLALALAGVLLVLHANTRT